MIASELKSRYTKLYGTDGVSDRILDKVEAMLGATLPEEFRFVSSFYAGGIIGVQSVLTVSDDPGDEWGMLGRTLQMRAGAKLPASLMVLALGPEDLVVLETIGPRRGRVYWLAFEDLAAMIDGVNIDQLPKSEYASYVDFIASLVEQEESIRGRRASDPE